MSTKIVKAPTLPMALPADDLPTVQTGPQLQQPATTQGAPAPQLPMEDLPTVQTGMPGAPQLQEATQTGALEPMTAPAPGLPTAPITDEFTTKQTDAQQLIGHQEKSLTVAPLELKPLELPPLTPFAEVPAVNLNRDQAFTELSALEDLGKIKYEVGESGRVKLFAPAFDVGFRHTSQSQEMAKDHWFDFPEPSMAVETARLASWAFDKGIDQISHRGFFGESGTEIEFGPKFPGHKPEPAVAKPTVQAKPIETKPQTAPTEVTTQTAQNASPTTQTADVTAQVAPKTETTAKPQTAQTTETTDKPKTSFLGSIAKKAGNAVKKFLQLDIAGFRGTDKETGAKFDQNPFMSFFRAPHDHFMKTMKDNRKAEAQQEQQRQEQEYQRSIEQQMHSNRLQQMTLQRAESSRQEVAQRVAEQHQKQITETQQPKPEELESTKQNPAATGAFHSPFANLHAQQLFGQLDDKKK